MAIFHLSAKIISRGKGKDATAASAYRSGEKIRDERTGLVHDYSQRTREGNILQKNIFMPPGTDWSPDRSELWNAVEAKNTRKDSQTAREIEISLPCELNSDERWRLASEFAQNLTIMYGVAADACVHAPRGENQNHHVHILLTTNIIETNGLGGKNRKMNSKNALKKIRKDWENAVNESLERAGHEVRIDCRSFADQGTYALPTIHEGVAASAMERKGIETEISNENRRRQSVNAEHQQLKMELAAIEKEFEDEMTLLERDIIQVVEEEEEEIKETAAPTNEEEILDINSLNDTELQKIYDELYEELMEIYQIKRDTFFENEMNLVEEQERKKRATIDAALETLNELLSNEPPLWKFKKHREWKSLQETAISELRVLLEDAGGTWEGRVKIDGKKIFIGEQSRIEYRQSLSYIEEKAAENLEAASDVLWGDALAEAENKDLFFAIQDEIQQRANEQARKESELKQAEERKAEERRMRVQLAQKHASDKLMEEGRKFGKSPYYLRYGENYIGTVISQTVDNAPGENDPNKVAIGMGGFVMKEKNGFVRIFYKQDFKKEVVQKIEQALNNKQEIPISLTAPTHEGARGTINFHLPQTMDTERARNLGR